MITIAKIILDIVALTIMCLCVIFTIGAICNYLRVPTHYVLLAMGVVLIVGMITMPLWARLPWWICLPTAALMVFKLKKDYRAEKAAWEVAARG